MSVLAFIFALIAFFGLLSKNGAISALRNRVSDLERKVKDLEKNGVAPSSAPDETLEAQAAPPDVNVMPEESPSYAQARFTPTVKDKGYDVPGNAEENMPAVEGSPAPQPAPEPEIKAEPVFQPVEEIRAPIAEPQPEPVMAATAVPAAEKEEESKPLFTAPKIDWEKFTGAKLFSWIGGILLFISIAFLVKYSLENNLISPTIRICSSIIIGFLCIVGSFFIKKEQYKTTSNTLAATGVAILYASVFAAQYFYGFISLQTAFIFMSIISLGGYLLAHCTDSKAVAVLSTIAGFMLPFINELPYQNQLLVFGFIFILNAGAITSAVRNKWGLVVKLCAIGTACIITGWFVNFFDADNYINLTLIMSVFLGGAGLVLVKFKEEFTEVTQLFIKVFLLLGTLFGAIVFTSYSGNYVQWTGIYLMLLPVLLYKASAEKHFTTSGACIMQAVLVCMLASNSFRGDYRVIISLSLLPVIFFVWNIVKKDEESNLRGVLNLIAAGALSLMAGAAFGGKVPYYVFSALMLLNVFNSIEEEQKPYRVWIIFITFAAQFFWALQSEVLGVNILIYVLGAFSIFNFALSKIGQKLNKDVGNYILALTLPFLSIVYMYINYKPDVTVVVKCSAFMLAMYAAAVHFTLSIKDTKGKYLIIPLASTLISLFMWNVHHLNSARIPLAAVWTAIAILIPLVSLLLTRMQDDKRTKDLFVYYTLATMITPIFILQKTGGSWLGFGAGFGLVLLINICLIFFAFDDKKNYGKKLLAYTSAATFMAELVWMGSYYETFNIFVILGVFAFFSILYTLLAFVLRKYETEEEDGPAGFFVLASMACASFMTTFIGESAQVIYGGFGFVLMSSIMLTSLVYKRKGQAFYITAMAIITFLIQAVWLARSGNSVYMKAGVLLPFIIFYFALPLLKGIKEKAAKVSASVFLTANIFFVISLLSRYSVNTFLTSSGLLLFISTALAYLFYKDKALYNIQFRAAAVLSFCYALICVDMHFGANESMLTLFFILAVIYGLMDYIHAVKNKTKESDIVYILSISAFYCMFAALADFKTAFAYLTATSALYLWFNFRTKKQAASIAVFAGTLLTETMLPSSAPVPGLIYIFLMAIMFMLPAFLSKEENKNILYGIAYTSGVAGFVMMYSIVMKYDFLPNAHGLWPLIWSIVYAAGRFIAAKKGENDTIKFLFGAAAFAFIVLAVPMQFSKQWITIFWALEGVIFMVAGLMRESKALRLASTALLMTVVLKLFFIDLWHLGGLYRIGAFMGTAVMLIAVSFFYQKFIKEK